MALNTITPLNIISIIRHLYVCLGHGHDNVAFERMEVTDLELKPRKKKYKLNGDDVAVSTDEIQSTEHIPNKAKEAELKRFGKGLALSVAYGANAGGIATLTGTPPNLILQGQANR